MPTTNEAPKIPTREEFEGFTVDRMVLATSHVMLDVVRGAVLGFEEKPIRAVLRCTAVRFIAWLDGDYDAYCKAQADGEVAIDAL